MSSYILVNGKYNNKNWWNDLIRACVAIGDEFEIHCWSDEKAEIEAALQYGQKIKHSWSGGTVIRGNVTEAFLRFLTEAPKPTDTEIYNKMTPFFSIFFTDKLYSEHYGTEVTISKVARENQPTVDRILDQMQDVGIVHRNID